MNTAGTGDNDREPEAYAEFLVEPFTEGNPGPHVQAAVDAMTEVGLDVDLGAFGSSTSGDVDEVAAGLAAMIRAGVDAGATRFRVHIAIEPTAVELPPSDLHSALTHLFRQVSAANSPDPADWSRLEKQAAVRELHQRGAFLLRGAVEDIARLMGVSRMTIYNYLSAIDGHA